MKNTRSALKAGTKEWIPLGQLVPHPLAQRKYDPAHAAQIAAGFDPALVGTIHVAKTKRMIQRAVEVQLSGAGFSFVEILTMCPTGWFIDTADAPAYLQSTIEPVHSIGVLKDRTAS